MLLANQGTINTILNPVTREAGMLSLKSRAPFPVPHYDENTAALRNKYLYLRTDVDKSFFFSRRLLAKTSPYRRLFGCYRSVGGRLDGIPFYRK